MTWEYQIGTGALTRNGIKVATGYSGKAQYKNNPSAQHIAQQGPIPVGSYTIRAPVNSSKTGPYVLNLLPHKDNVMFGRSAFQIHGDSVSSPGNASSGCIILPRNIREKIWLSGDVCLVVNA